MLCSTFFCRFSPQDEEKYIVFRSCLWELLDTCPVCTQPCTVDILYKRGTMIAVEQQCNHCHYNRKWTSQPLLGDIPAGNLLLSAAILFTGSSYTKVLRVLETMNICALKSRTFQEHWQLFLHPTMWHFYQDQQRDLIRQLQDMPGDLVLGGDGRADSPGYSAKFGSYTVIELRLNKVLDLQLVQVHVFPIAVYKCSLHTCAWAAYSVDINVGKRACGAFDKLIKCFVFPE